MVSVDVKHHVYLLSICALVLPISSQWQFRGGSGCTPVCIYMDCSLVLNNSNQEGMLHFINFGSLHSDEAAPGNTPVYWL